MIPTRHAGTSPVHGVNPATIASPSMAIDDEAIYSIVADEIIDGGWPYVDAELAHPINHTFSGLRHRMVFFR